MAIAVGTYTGRWSETEVCPESAVEELEAGDDDEYPDDVQRPCGWRRTSATNESASSTPVGVATTRRSVGSSVRETYSNVKYRTKERNRRLCVIGWAIR